MIPQRNPCYQFASSAEIGDSSSYSADPIAVERQLNQSAVRMMVNGTQLEVSYLWECKIRELFFFAGSSLVVVSSNQSAFYFEPVRLWEIVSGTVCFEPITDLRILFDGKPKHGLLYCKV